MDFFKKFLTNKKKNKTPDNVKHSQNSDNVKYPQNMKKDDEQEPFMQCVYAGPPRKL